jgi:cobalt-zinc-cadmium efflux system outer membrane protein
MRNRHAWIQAAFVLSACLAGHARPLCGQQTDSLPRPAQVLSDAAPRVAALPFTQPPAVHERTVPPTALTFQQLEQLAAVHNPTLGQAARRVEALEGEQVQVGLYPNPVAGYISEEIGEEGQAGQHGVYVRQELVTANKLGWNRAVASQEVLQAQWELQVQQWRVTNAVRIQAYEVLAAQRTVEVTEELFAIGKAAVDAAERLFQARQVSQVDVLQARVEANSAQLHLIAARKTRDAAWRRLVIVIGVPDMKPAPLVNRLDDVLPEIAWSDTVQHLRDESPQVAAARTGVERARHAVARACAGRTPNIETGAAVRRNDLSESTTLSLQIGVPLMIFDRNQGNIMRAQAELMEAQQNLERVELQLQDRLAEVYREYEIAREQVTQYRQAILPDARKSLELTRAGYQQNEFGYLELLTAQQTFTRTNLAYIAALRELWLSITKIDGMLLTGGLEAPQS